MNFLRCLEVVLENFLTAKVVVFFFRRLFFSCTCMATGRKLVKVSCIKSSLKSLLDIVISSFNHHSSSKKLNYTLQRLED